MKNKLFFVAFFSGILIVIFNTAIVRADFNAGGFPINSIPLVGFFSGSSDNDLVTFSNGTWNIMYATNGWTKIDKQYLWGTNGDIPLLADIDGDGKSDLIIYRPSNNYWYILLSSKNYDPNSALILTFSQGGTPLVGDVDGDGKADLALFNSGTWSIALSSHSYNANQIATYSWGCGTACSTAGDKPFLADFDGDGKADLVTWRDDFGFDVLSSIGNFNYKSFSNQVFGVGTVTLGDIPLVYDLDNDGKADYTIWRGNYGIWFYYPSTKNYWPGGYQENFGNTGDISLIGRFNGKTSVVSYTPSSGSFSIHNIQFITPTFSPIDNSGKLFVNPPTNYLPGQHATVYYYIKNTGTATRSYAIQIPAAGELIGIVQIPPNSQWPTGANTGACPDIFHDGIARDCWQFYVPNNPVTLTQQINDLNTNNIDSSFTFNVVPTISSTTTTTSSTTSTTQTTMINPIGWLDTTDCEAFRGWACDGNNYAQIMNVTFYKDGPQGTGTFIGSIAANELREQAVGNVCGGYANHGFVFSPPLASLNDGNQHSIYAYAKDIPTGNLVALSGIPKTFNAPACPYPKDAIALIPFSSWPANWGQMYYEGSSGALIYKSNSTDLIYQYPVNSFSYAQLGSGNPSVGYSEMEIYYPWDYTKQYASFSEYFRLPDMQNAYDWRLWYTFITNNNGTQWLPAAYFIPHPYPQGPSNSWMILTPDSNINTNLGGVAPTSRFLANFSMDPNSWHYAKLVVDLNKKEYVSLQIDDRYFDLTGIRISVGTDPNLANLMPSDHIGIHNTLDDHDAQTDNQPAAVAHAYYDNISFEFSTQTTITSTTITSTTITSTTTTSTPTSTIVATSTTSSTQSPSNCFSPFWNAWVNNGSYCCHNLALGNPQSICSGGYPCYLTCPTDALFGWQCINGNFIATNPSSNCPYVGASQSCTINGQSGTQSCSSNCFWNNCVATSLTTTTTTIPTSSTATTSIASATSSTTSPITTTTSTAITSTTQPCSTYDLACWIGYYILRIFGFAK